MGRKDYTMNNNLNTNVAAATAIIERLRSNGVDLRLVDDECDVYTFHGEEGDITLQFLGEAVVGHVFFLGEKHDLTGPINGFFDRNAGILSYSFDDREDDPCEFCLDDSCTGCPFYTSPAPQETLYDIIERGDASRIEYCTKCKQVIAGYDGVACPKCGEEDVPF